MEQHNDFGTPKDLAEYRIETAKSDLNAAKILYEAGEMRGQIIELIMQYIMRYLQYML